MTEYTVRVSAWLRETLGKVFYSLMLCSETSDIQELGGGSQRPPRRDNVCDPRR